MLRAGLLLFGFVVAGIGLVLLRTGDAPAAKVPLLFGTLLLVALLGERWRYRRKGQVPQHRWQPTGERFEDPETGRTMEVFYDPVSGERCYRAQDDPPPPSA